MSDVMTTLQLEMDVSFAKYLLALYSALIYEQEMGPFDSILAHEDLPEALRVLRDQVSRAGSYGNLGWSDEQCKWVEDFIAGSTESWRRPRPAEIELEEREHEPSDLLRARLARAVRERREEMGQSLSKLCQDSGVPQATISAIERGETMPRLDVALALCRALAMDINDLF